MVVIGLFFGIIVGFLVYRDAKRCGMDRNKALGWGLGITAATIIRFPLLLLVLAAYFLIGRKKQLPQEVQTIDIEATVVDDNCPSCGRIMRETFAVCPYCGCKLQR